MKLPKRKKALMPARSAAPDAAVPIAIGRAGDVSRRPNTPTNAPPIAKAAVHHASYRPIPTTVTAQPAANTARLVQLVAVIAERDVT
jgi:hypothetical protein